MKHAQKIILLWVIIPVIILVFALDKLIERMYRYEIKQHRSTPEKYQIPFKEVTIPAAGGASLYGWWVPATPTAPTLILVHGWSRNLSRTLHYIQKLHPLGYNLLAFDARNHGRSSVIKRPTVETFADDILTVVDFVAQSDWVSSPDVGVIGLSIGGGAAVNAAGQDRRIKSVITVGAIAHPVAVMNVEFQKRGVPNFVAATLLTYMRFRFGLDFDNIAPVNNIRRAEAEMLIIHGDDDQTIPLEQGQMLAAAGRKGKTELWVALGKGHSDCDTHPQFWERVNTFLQKTVPVNS